MTLLGYLGDRLRAAAPANSLRARLAGGALWTLAAAVIGQSFSFVASVITARILGNKPFGELGMVTSTVMLFGTVAGAGLGVTASRYTAQLRPTDPARAGRVAGLMLVIAGVTGLAAASSIAMCARALAVRVLDNRELVTYIRLACPTLLVGTIGGVATAVLMGLHAFRKLAIAAIIMAPCAAALGVAGAASAGVAGSVTAGILTALAGMVVNLWLLKVECALAGIPLQFRGCWAEWRLLTGFAVPSLLAMLLVPLVNWAVDALLVNTPNGYAELGLFNVADQWRGLLLFLPSVVAGPLLPILSELYATRQYDRLRRALVKCLAANLVVVTPAAVIVGVLSPYLMRMYGPAFAGASTVLVFIVAVVILLSIGVVTGQLLATMGEMWYGFLFNAVWAVIVVMVSALLVRAHGAVAAAAAYAAGYAIHTIIQALFLAHRLAGLRRLQRQEDLSSASEMDRALARAT